MRILMINSVCGIGSTGRICTDLADELESQGNEVKIAYGRGEVPDQYKKYAVKIGNDFGVKFHGLKARLYDKSGFGSKHATSKFIKWVRNYNPDMIHLHNIHGYYINIEILFNYLKNEFKGKIIWTLHDCWAFTGHCSYFTMAKCEQWKAQCMHCADEQKKSYPKCSFISRPNSNFKKKKELFTGISNITFVTPSQWLADLLSQSFLKNYPVKVINNGIDLDVFKPTDSYLREKYHIQNKKIILGVASVWDKRKGLDDFIKLSEIIEENIQIVLIGLSQKQIECLPNKIIAIQRTNNAQELAEWYSTADLVFVPTYEDNYPTVNLEAQACGTPVITYRTGGSVESVPPENVIACGDVEEAARIIGKQIHELKVLNFMSDKETMVNRYVSLY